jgi:hypothetical protein
VRDFLRAVVRCVAFAWCWPLVLLALPNCSLDHSVRAVPPHLTSGDLPHSSAIMCDIEKYPGPTRRCATPQDLAMGIPLTMAAEKLVTGEASSVGLDYSPAAEVACGAGIPQAIAFLGSFPEGSAVCLNCGVIGMPPRPHLNATAVCVARCQDLVAHGEAPMPPDILAFCTAHAHPSTNFPTSGCFDNACSPGGMLRDDFVDPRQFPEPVVWTDFIGTSAVGSSLTDDSAPTGNFDAGAVSTQWIHGNDGYVEFEANENNLSHVVGFSEVSGACPFPCTDRDPGYTSIDFAISLNSDGRFYVFEHGAIVSGPDVNGSFGTYVAGTRFRLKLKRNLNGTATVSYFTIAGACVPGHPCIEVPFPDPVPPHVGPVAEYPLRVDTSFREENARLANVSIVHIKQP